MANPIERLGKVRCSHHSAEWRFPLVKTVRDKRSEGKEGGNGGATRTEAMLKGGLRKRGEKKRTKETLKDFGGGAEEGDRAVRGAKIKGFTRFGYGQDEGMFPDCREVSMRDREVEETGEEGDSFGA